MHDDHRDAGAAGRVPGDDAEGLVMEDAGAPGGAPALRLHPALELFFAPDGDAYLLRGGSGREHVIRAPDDADQELLRRLASGAVAPDERAMDRLGPLLTAGA